MAKRKTRKKTSGPTQIVMRESVSLVPRRRSSGPPARRASVRPIYVSSSQTVRRAPARRSGGGGGAHVGNRVRKGAAIAGLVIGYLDRPGSAMESTIAKIPALGGSRKITIALGLHLLARKRPGGYIDHAATAMTAIAAYDVGRNGLANLGLQGPDEVARF